MDRGAWRATGHGIARVGHDRGALACIRTYKENGWLRLKRQSSPIGFREILYVTLGGRAAALVNPL